MHCPEPPIHSLLLDEEILDATKCLDRAPEILGIGQTYTEAMQNIPRTPIIAFSRIIAERDHLLGSEPGKFKESVDGTVFLHIIRVIAANVIVFLGPTIGLGSRKGQQRIELSGIGLQTHSEIEGLPHRLLRLAYCPPYSKHEP